MPWYENLRKYCDGVKRMHSLRFPDVLYSRLEEMAARRQRTVSDLIMTILDDAAQKEDQLLAKERVDKAKRR